MNPSSNSKAEYVKKRRAEKEYHFGWPLRKRVIQKIERLNKRLTLGLLGKLMRTKKIEGKLPLSAVKKVLILRTDAIGDMVVTSPVWKMIKRANPSIEIGIAGSFRNIDIIKCDADVDHIFDLTKKDKKELAAEYERCRAQQFDLVFCCTLHKRTKSAITAWKCAPKAYRVTTVTTNPERHGEIFSKTVELPDTEFPIPMPVQLQAMAEETIELNANDADKYLSVALCPESKELVSKKIAAILDTTGTTEYIVVNTESANIFREWGYENNFQLSEALATTFPTLQIFLTSSPNREAELIAFLGNKAPNKRIQYFPTRNLHELTTLLSQSKLVVTPDTSVVHLSSATRRPVVGFFLRHNEWLPYRVAARIFIPKEKDPVTSIPLEPVLAASVELLTSSKSDQRVTYCTTPVTSKIVPAIETSDLTFTS